MVKQKVGNNKRLFFVLLGVVLLAITTTIVLNGTAILQKFGANAYVPNPIIFATYSEVKVGTNTVQKANDFFKFSELFPIQEADAILEKNKKTAVDLLNEFGWNKGNQAIGAFGFSLTRSNLANYKYLWLNFSVNSGAVIHSMNDSHYDFNYPYFEYNNGMGAPWGVYIKTTMLDNNQANCTKSYLKKYASQMVNTDGSTNNQGFWWKNIQPAYLAYPKRPGTYYVSNPVCFAPFETFEKRSFDKMVDTRYDKNKKASDYALQTGTYVIAIINHPTQTQYLFERMYFSDNSATTLNFTQKYCAIKGASDPIHCVKGNSGAYRGIDIMKDGRLYNLAAFEQVGILPVKTTLSGQAVGTVVGGPFAFQWWQQTLGSKANYWDYDNVNSSGTDVPHTMPQQATTWKVSLMK